jgi:chromosomal replication initiator protein
LNVWDKTVGALRELVEPYDFKHWIQPVACEEIDEKQSRIVLRVPDASHGQWLQENFLDHIRQAMSQVCSERWSIAFKATEQGTQQESPERPHIAPATPAPRLIPHYRFDQFVFGPNNQFALTAARAVAERPGIQYNPLFLYGGVGLGKTHLLHAIGHEVRRNNPRAQVLYVTSETFVNDLIRAIRSGRMDGFRLKYRDNCDVLLIDDIQFIAGKERTQEEFFHMFNTLHSYGKQIVLTCDQIPRSIPDMEDRLRSRLEWGLIADIKPPSFETRVAIVRSKAEVEGVALEPDVAMFLARHIVRNVRELEGALKRLIAQSRMFSTAITMGMVQEVLNQMNLAHNQHVNIGDIIKLVAHDYNLTVADLKGPRRQRNITLPRQVAMLLARELTECSLPQIGKAFGGRDHTTVINSLKRMELFSRTKPELNDRVARLRKELTS